MYISFVLSSQIYAFFDINNTLSMFLLLVGIVLISFFIANVALYFLNKIKFEFKTENKKCERKKFIINFIIVFIIGLILYNLKIVTGKAMFEVDFSYAMRQAEQNSYATFSSPIFILIFAKLPMMIFNNPFFISTFYVLIRSLIVAYIISELSFNVVINILLIIFYCFFPLSIHSETTLLKDTPCAIFTAISILLIYKHYNSSKNNYLYEILIAAFLALANFMRPNAVIFSGLMIIVLFIILKQDKIKSYIRILIVFIAFLIVGNVVIPKCVKIVKNDPSFNKVEVMSIPAVTIMAVAKQKPESLNDKEKECLKVMCGENLEALEYFNPKVGWESVKFNQSIYMRKNLPFSYFDLASYTLDLLIREPAITIRQIIRSTSSLYGYRYIDRRRNSVLSNVYYMFANIEVGVLFLILISFLIAKCSMFDRSRVNILLAIPIIFFSVVTALIIASPAITRYYLPLQMAVPIFVIEMIFMDKKRNY